MFVTAALLGFASMFLRKNRKKVNGEFYEYWTLCESVRTQRGPRQRVLASLGKFTEEDLHAGWEDIEALLDGRTTKRRPRQAEFGDCLDEHTDNAQWELADLSNLRVERLREFGSVFLAMALWRRLGLHQLLDELLPKGRERIAWKDVAAVLSVGKFCGQASELAIAEQWYSRTALDEIVSIDPQLINDDRLYRGLDHLGKHKDRLCEHLMTRYRDWFGVRYELLLYDVTSTYFEGACENNAKAARGYSRDKRSDCKQVCIGLVCTPEGLPLSFEVFAGNRTDVTTVEAIVTKMEERHGQPGRVWVMDRGMVSKSNIDFLRERKAFYVVGTAKSELRHFQSHLLETTDWSQVQAGLEAKLVSHPDGNAEEKYVLCRSTQRAQKERAILTGQMDKLTAELVKVDTAIRRQERKLCDIGKIERRIGRWLGKYPKAARLLKVEVLRDASSQPIGLSIYCPLEGQEEALRQGTYLLRTNCTETDPARIWRWYVQLTQAEAAFRTSKSDIGLRPIYHQKTDRVEAHLLICFLNLAMWRSLEMWTQSKGLGTCARKLIEAVSTIRSMDVIVPVKRGDKVSEVRLRTVARPDKDVSLLLAQLGLKLPQRNKTLTNVVEKIAP